MTPQEMRVLFDYNAWANHRALEAACRLTTEQFCPNRWDRVSAPCAIHLDIFSAPKWLWLERFQGRSPASLPDTAQFKDLAGLRNAGMSTNRACSVLSAADAG